MEGWISEIPGQLGLVWLLISSSLILKLREVPNGNRSGITYRGVWTSGGHNLLDAATASKMDRAC